jgi:SHS family lactate transporter-like MFS transporter
MLQYNYQYCTNEVTLIQVTANIGALVGSAAGGYCSQIWGRRFSIVCFSIVGAALIYPYTFRSGPGTYAAAFFEQLCVQGAFGVIPIHLMELSPPAFRTFIVGTSYNLGVLVASASNTIITKIGERYPLHESHPLPACVLDEDPLQQKYNYAPAICILAACTFVYVIIVALLGPEWRGRRLDMRVVGAGDQPRNPIDYRTSDRDLWRDEDRPRF